MTGLINELLQEIRDVEAQSDKVKKIKVNPVWRSKLLLEHNAAVNIKLARDDSITIQGIPIEETADVEKWEIVI